jgi:hypothetical protein
MDCDEETCFICAEPVELEGDWCDTCRLIVKIADSEDWE